MDIYETLKSSGESLYIEDLDYFETELATNDKYDEIYKSKCMLLIEDLRNWKRSNSDEFVLPKKRRGSKKKNNVDKLILGANELMDSDVGKSREEIEEMIISDISTIRKSRDYKKMFKKYLNENSQIDEEFVDKHFAMFRKTEMSEILTYIPMSEAFIEKYFNIVDLKIISAKQYISEEFFIKHFNDLDVEKVLYNKRNEWAEKGNRSTQLDVFLRLRGVKL